LHHAAKLRLKRDQWKAASARYYERHPEVKEKKRLKMSEARCVYLGSTLHIYELIYYSAAKKQARRRWDPPRVVHGRPATVDQHLSDEDGLTVNHDVDLKSRDATAEELRAVRRARMEVYAEYVRQLWILTAIVFQKILFKTFSVVSGCDGGKARCSPRTHQLVNRHGKPALCLLMS
jgi:hypothetical protein